MADNNKIIEFPTGHLENATKEIKKMEESISSLGKNLGDVAETIDKVGGGFSVLATGLEAGSTAIKAWDSLQSVGKITDQLSEKFSALSGVSTLLSGPFGLVSSIAAGAIPIFSALAGHIQAQVEKAEQQKRVQEELANSFVSSIDSIGKYSGSVAEATSIINNLTPAYTMSNEARQKMDAGIIESEEKMLAILENSSDKKKSLSAEEKADYESNLEAFREHYSQRLDAQKEAQEKTLTLAEALKNNEKLSTDERIEQSHRLLKTAEETRDKSLGVLQEQTDKEKDLLTTKFLNTKELTQEEYEEQLDLIDERNSKEKEAISGHYAETYEITKAGLDNNGILLDENMTKFDEYLTKDGEARAAHNEKIKEIDEELKKYEYATSESDFAKKAQLQEEKRQLEEKFNEDIGVLREEGLAGFVNASEQEREIWLEKQLAIAESGKGISESTRALLSDMINHINDANNPVSQKLQNIIDTADSQLGKVGEEFKEGGEDAKTNFLDPLNGMEEDTKEAVDAAAGNIPSWTSGYGFNIFEAAAGLASNFITGFKQKLGINSPSRVMKQLMQWTLEGAIDGVESEKGNLYRTVDKVVDEVKDTFATLGKTDQEIAIASITNASQDEFQKSIGQRLQAAANLQMKGEGLLGQAGDNKTYKMEVNFNQPVESQAEQDRRMEEQWKRLQYAIR